MTLAFLLAAAWRPERACARRFPWLALAAFYAALLLFLADVVGE